MKIISILICLIASYNFVLAGELPLSPVCWPLNFAGITLGVTTDPQVVRFLGEGLNQTRATETASRYYVDKDLTATLHTKSYTDYIVGELTVEEGVRLSPEEAKIAISPWFDPKEQFGNWHKLHLGSSKTQVVENLGLPSEGKETDAWEYQSACACELPVYFTLYFRSDKIYKVVFSAPPG